VDVDVDVDIGIPIRTNNHHYYSLNILVPSFVSSSPTYNHVTVTDALYRPIDDDPITVRTPSIIIIIIIRS
jgi:hypothetical protein